MPKLKIREYLPEYKGMKDVIKQTTCNGRFAYHTMETPFVDLAKKVGACKLNFSDNEYGFYLHLFNSNNEAVGMYKMTPRLRGFTQQQLSDQYKRLFYCKLYNQDRDMWETYIDGRLVKADIYKDGCGLATILKDDKWSVIDRNNNVVVPPGKYDYIDGFDKCGLARVKINGKVHIFDPKKNTYDKWGLIDTKGDEILPLEYSEIWSFYNKGRKSTSVFWGGFDKDDDYNYIERLESYLFILPCKDYPKGLLKGPGEWFGNRFQTYEEIAESNLDYNYSVWDALDGEPEAAGNIDYEW